MNPPRCGEEDYIDFLVASPKSASAVEAARVQPEGFRAAAHDAFTRLLHRLEPDPAALWDEVRPHAPLGGVLVVDDSTLDKPHARHIGLVTPHWSGKHKAVVRGINLVTLLATDGDACVPCDYRVYRKDDLTKNEHFRDMLAAARDRGFRPECVAFDGWYASLENLKLVRSFGWHFLTRLKSNRLVNPDGSGPRPLASADICAAGTVIHLTGFGVVKVFRLVAPDGDTEHWATNDLGADEMDRLRVADCSWRIEVYHRAIKQHCGAERCQVRSERGQRNHLGLVLRAFVRLELHRLRTGVAWGEAKLRIIRDAVRAYIARPTYRMPATA